MDGNAGTRREREALGGIVALLLALAALAERAAGRSLPVRWLVLPSLRHADDVARHVFVGPSAADRQMSASPIRCGHEPADAINLAVSLRALALVVKNIAARLLQRSAAQASDESSHDASRRRPGESLWRAANAGPEPLDTS